MKIKTILILVLLAGLTACSSFANVDQPDHSAWQEAETNTSVSQTVTATYNGLRAVGLYLAPGSANKGRLNLAIYQSNQAADVLRRSSMPLEKIKSAGFYILDFLPLPDSNNQNYYLKFDVEGNGDIKIGTAPADSYLNGSMYSNNEPSEGQLTFDLIYGNKLRAAGLAKESLSWLAWILASIYLFIIPGWAIFHFIWPDWRELAILEKAGLAGGMSLAIYPILILWTHFFGLNLGKWYAALPGAAGLLLLLIIQVKDYRKPIPGSKVRTFLSGLNTSHAWQSLIGLGILTLVAALRFFVIRGLDVPLWGDSYHHTLITQLLVENRGLFDSWLPYAELQSFTYHFGFHSLAGAFTWLTGMPAPQSTLITGQIINILAVMALYPLAVKVGRSQWAGIIAILVAGLLLNTPMSYLNWGRYTQLTGQVILPVVMLYSWTLLQEHSFRWSLISAGWMLYAAMALSHYRVAALGILFFLSVLLFQTRLPTLKRNLLLTVALGAGSIIIFLPWVFNTFGGGLFRIFFNQATTLPSQAAEFVQRSSSISDYFSYLPMLAWLGLIIIIGWGLWRRDIWVGIFSAWMVLVWFATNPAWLGLPGTGLISNFTIFIAAYIPASILLGAGCSWSIQLVKGINLKETKYFTVLQMVSLLILSLVAIWGGLRRINDIQVEQQTLVTKPDLHAFEWIRQNLPENANFLVNSFFAFGNTSIAGSDGGWWLPFFTNRSSNLPPMPYAFEKGPQPDYARWVNQLPAEIQKKGITHPDSLQLLEERGINFIYIGQQQGSVNSGNAKIDVNALQNHPAFEPVYHQDRVWVFRFSPDT